MKYIITESQYKILMEQQGEPTKCAKNYINFLFKESFGENGRVVGGGDLAHWNYNIPPTIDDEEAYDRFIEYLKYVMDSNIFDYGPCENITFEDISPIIQTLYLNKIIEIQDSIKVKNNDDNKRFKDVMRRKRRQLYQSGGYLKEVKKVHDDYSISNPVYEYKKIGIIPNTYNPNEIGYVFFNGVYGLKTDYLHPEENVMITFTGPMGDFKFDSRVVEQTKMGSPYIKRWVLNDKYYDRLLPLMVVKTPQQKPLDILSNKKNDGFTKNEILSALEMAFPDNWVKGTNDYAAGLRGIHTIGKRNNTDEDWSIMNYFDTKREVKKLIDDKWEEEGFGDKIEWLSSVLKNDDEFLRTLLNVQWDSIKSGFENENRGLENILSSFKSLGDIIEYEVYPPGHKKDRYESTDITLKIDNKPPITIQIKPLTKLEKIKTGSYKVRTYGMKNSYKFNKNLNYIMYNKGDSFIMFDNKNYVVPDLSKGKEVIHMMEPYKVYNMNI